MKKIVTLCLVYICCVFSGLCKEFDIHYNKNTDQEYYLSYRTIDDQPGTLEIFKSYCPHIIDVLEFPDEIEYEGEKYIVTTLRLVGFGSNLGGPKKIIIPSTIRYIRDGLWSDFLEEVIIDDAPIEELDPYSATFKNCSNLKSVVWGNACVLKTFPPETFSNCTNLEEVVLPESLEDIGDEAFLGCSSLKNIVIPPSVNRLNRTFVDCISLENVEFKGNSVGGINEAFINCISLKNITIPFTERCDIYDKVFSNCRSLESVIMKAEEANSNFSIGDYAFDNCVNLTEIKYGSSTLDNIGEGAFNGCSSLKKITIPSTCWIKPKAFAGCKNLEKFEVEFMEGLWPKLSSIDGVLIQEQHELLSYPSGKKDTDYTVPSGITRIANGAFEGAVNLTDVTLGENVTELGVMTFRDCKALKNVKLPESIGYLPSGTFMGCAALEKIDIPDHYSYLGTASFHDCETLSEVKLPSELKVLGESSFVNCSKIEEITIPEGVKSLRPATFRDCKSLKSVTLPQQLDTIHRASFQGCKALESIVLPESLKSIEDRALKGCESLMTVVIPDGVTEIGNNAFEDCTSLKNVTVGNGVKDIGNWAFYDCSDLETVILGSSLETIGEGAFDGADNISSITCLSETPPSYPTGFSSEVLEKAEVTVPEGSEENYNSDITWAPLVEGSDNIDTTIPVTLIQFEENSLIMLIGESYPVFYTVYPADATEPSLSWSSSDESVTSVDEEGHIKAVATGTAVITATAVDGSGVKAECRVNVVNETPNSIDSIFTDDEVCADIYRPDGTCLLRGCTKDDLSVLRAGLYIVRTSTAVFKLRIP